MLSTSLTQTLNIDHDNTLYGTGKRNRLAHFRVHKPSPGVRMFESIVFAGQFIRMKEGQCDVNVSALWIFPPIVELLFTLYIVERGGRVGLV